MESFHLLGSLARDLHFEFRNLYYVLLPIFFSLALVIEWIANPIGGPNVIELIKRTFIATLLLVAFVEISDAIILVANGISERIGDMSGLDSLLKMAGEKARSYPMKATSLIFGSRDLVLATLSFLSFLILYVARYLMVALYHFGWTFLTILSPLLLLFHLFSPKITLNLFKSLIEVASWQIVWSVLSVMLKSIPYGDASVADGSYLTLIILNFVIAICMLLTPLIVHALVGSGFSSIAGSIGAVTAATILALPTKALALVQVGRQVLSRLTPSPENQTGPPEGGPTRGQFVAVSPLSPEPGHHDVPEPPPPAPILEKREPQEPSMPPYDPSLQGFSEPTRK